MTPRRAPGTRAAPTAPSVGQLINAFAVSFKISMQASMMGVRLPCQSNIDFPLREKTRLSEAEIAKRVRVRLVQMSLTSEVETKFPDELSGGMKKRVALARAMIQEPEIMFYDEPVTGLDPPMTNTVFHLITKTHQESGYTALMVSHDIPEVFSVAHQVAMLHQGRIIAAGTPDEIQNHPDPTVQSYHPGRS